MITNKEVIMVKHYAVSYTYKHDDFGFSTNKKTFLSLRAAQDFMKRIKEGLERKRR